MMNYQPNEIDGYPLLILQIFQILKVIIFFNQNKETLSQVQKYADGFSTLQLMISRKSGYCYL